MKSRLIALGIVLLVASSSFAQSPTPARRPITETDLFDFVWVADPQVSPDGSRVAFTRVNVDAKRTGYETSIWLASIGGQEPPIRLTHGARDSRPRWSPDGTTLAFVRVAGGGDSGRSAGPQIALLPMSGGEARIITDLPGGAAGPVWSPDGKRLAFLSSTAPGDVEKPEGKTDERKSDVRVISRAVYRANGAGYLDFSHPDHLWVIDVPAPSGNAPKPVQLTRGDYDEGDAFWSKDGSRLYYLTTRLDEPYYELGTTDICSVAVTGGEPTKLTTIPMDIRNPALSPDGRLLAFHGAVTEPVRSYSQPDLWVMDLTPNARPRNLTADYDFDMGGGVGGDNAAPRGGSGRTLHWSPDGQLLIDTVARRGRAPLVRVDVQSGAVTELTRGDRAVMDFTATPDARTVVALVSTPTMIGDLFAVSADGTESRLTDVNGALWSQLSITGPEEITYRSFDGREIQGWIQQPPDFDRKKSYPLILNIHGGPHSAYGWVFDHEFQWMAARGYVVLYVNPRGSTSYGQEFGNIIQHRYPGDDYRDLMIGVDELLKDGYVDPKKLGVTGGSGGGVLTNWTVTHTDRFAAAVSQRDISNWASWWYTADFTLFQPSWFKAPPFQDPDDYANRSAITFVENIHTPILFVLGEADSRTPPESGGMQLFRALKYLKRPTAMVLFPRETHELSRSGEPWHRIERLRHIVNWFDKWMLGVPHPEYDVRPPGQGGDRRPD